MKQEGTQLPLRMCFGVGENICTANPPASSGQVHSELSSECFKNSFNEGEEYEVKRTQILIFIFLSYNHAAVLSMDDVCHVLNGQRQRKRETL